MTVSGFMALSTVFHSINSPDNSPLSHSVLPVSFPPCWSFSTTYLFMKVSLSHDIILCSWLGLKHQLTSNSVYFFFFLLLFCFSSSWNVFSLNSSAWYYLLHEDSREEQHEFYGILLLSVTCERVLDLLADCFALLVVSTGSSDCTSCCTTMHQCGEVRSTLRETERKYLFYP